MLTVGLIGFGAVGRDVARLLLEGAAGETRLAGALVRDTSKHSSSSVPIFDDVASFLGQDLQLVIEAAGQEAVRELATRVLQAEKDLVVTSVGALANAAFCDELRALSKRTQRQVIVCSGSVGALDAIGSGAIGGLTDVTHTIRKPPRAFTSEQLRGRADRESVIFEGTVSDGAQLFPENANAATAVGLAGLGPDRTRLRIISDPALQRNVQEVDVTGAFGHLRFVIENVPSSNPKTSRLVALSVVRVLRDLSSSFLIR